MKIAPLTDKGSTTRTKILAQARKMLIKRGYGKLIMREVAASCEMKLGNLQYYFPSHDALIRAIIEAETQQDLLATTQVLQENKNPKNRLSGIVRELLQRWRGASGIIFSTLNLLALHDKDYQKLYQDSYAKYYILLDAVIKEVSPGQTRQEYAIRSRLLCALIDGAPYQINLKGRAAFFSRIEDHAYDIAMGA